MFVSRLPLVEFYTELLPAAREAGYKIVLTALAREADAPSFYHDVERYWTSLHDATGPHILFVLAGWNAGEALHDHGIPHRWAEGAVGSNHIALAGRQRLHWTGGLGDPPSWESNSVLKRGSPRLEADIDIASRHTLEITELRRFLRLSEADLPCLVFTVLKSTPNSHSVFIPVEFSRLRARADRSGWRAPSLGPFHELDGEDERYGEGDLGFAVNDVAVGVSAELTEVGEPRVGPLHRPAHAER